MSDSEKVRVFISWSGDASKRVAQELRTAIGACFDLVLPFMSDVDIEGGQRGLSVIEGQLNESQFGIIVVTRFNMSAPWLNFEAGAISKVLHGDEARVIPVLVDIPGPAELAGPLAQFQAKRADQHELGLVFEQIGKVAGVDAGTVARRFSGVWPDIAAAVQEAVSAAGSRHAPLRSTESMVAEVLELVRSLRRDTEGNPGWSHREQREAGVRVIDRERAAALAVFVSGRGFGKEARVRSSGDGTHEVLLPYGVSAETAEALAIELAEMGMPASVRVDPF